MDGRAMEIIIGNIKEEKNTANTKDAHKSFMTTLLGIPILYADTAA